MGNNRQDSLGILYGKDETRAVSRSEIVPAGRTDGGSGDITARTLCRIGD